MPAARLDFARHDDGWELVISPPDWLTAPAEPGVTTAFDLPVRSLGADIQVLTWAPAEARDDEPLPLLVVHDGPEYDRLASLTRYLSAGVTGNWLPRLRAALLGPGPRNRWYSANAGYARAVHQSVIPALTTLMPSTARIGMGTSLGALAMLHVHAATPMPSTRNSCSQAAFSCRASTATNAGSLTTSG